MAHPQARKAAATFCKAFEASDDAVPPDDQKLYLLGYRSYRHEIKIFHYHDVRYSVDQLRKWFSARHERYNFVGSFISTDTIADFAIHPGDEVPRGWIEVGYLAHAFSNSLGCALGFRRGGDVIEWLIFRESIEHRILDRFLVNKSTLEIQTEYNLHPDHEWRLFNFVAWAEKGLEKRCVRGANPEHRAWWESLERATWRKVKLTLTWNSKGTDYMKMKHKNVDKVAEEEEFGDMVGIT